MEVSSARGRADGAIRSATDRRPVGQDPALAPETTPAPARPRADDRKVLEGILWMLRSGARGQDLPEAFPSPSTCWRRLRDWEEQEVWLEIWRAFLGELNERQQLKWSEAFLDGSFAPAKKGAAESAKPSGARGRRGWWGSIRQLTDGYSSGRLPSLCFPVGGPARRGDASVDPRRAAASARPTAPETRARNR